MTGPPLAARTAGMRSSKLRELVAAAAGPGDGPGPAGAARPPGTAGPSGTPGPDTAGPGSGGAGSSGAMGPVLSLGGGLPPAEAIPSADLARAAARLLARDPHAALRYSPAEGDPVLREALAGWLAADLPAPDGRIVVTAGAQQALDLVAKVLLDPGDVAVVESPTYVGALRAFAAYQPRIEPVPVDGAGLDTDVLQARLAGGLRPKLCYVVPNFANPSGATMSGPRRRHLAELAARYGFLVVEDDPYGQLRFRGTALPPVASHGDHVVYLGSFSKLVAPGLRVGYAVAPPTLYRPLVVAKQAADLASSSLGQRLVAELLTEPGWLDGQVTRLRGLYRRRARALVDAIGRRLPGRLAAPLPEGGMFAWATVTAGGVSAVDLARAATCRGVAVVPGDEFTVVDSFPRELRLSFSMLAPADLDEAVARLAAAFDDLGVGR